MGVPFSSHTAEYVMEQSHSTQNEGTKEENIKNIHTHNNKKHTLPHTAHTRRLPPDGSSVSSCSLESCRRLSGLARSTLVHRRDTDTDLPHTLLCCS